MGWVESPPYFCAATETIADLVNNWPAHVLPAPHPMEEVSQTPPPTNDTSLGGSPVFQPVSPPPSNPALPACQPEPLTGAPSVLRPFLRPVSHTDVYVDDFCQLIQGPPRARMNHLRRLLHSIDAVFRPLDDNDSPLRKSVPSLKKFLAGDAFWATRKILLGWLVDTIRQTLELPPHRIQRLQDLFENLRGKTRVSAKTWHKVLGELRSMALGIPGSRGLFSLLQEGLRHSDKYRIRITPEMRDQLEDFEHLSKSLATRPTELAEIVPDHPVAVGPHDASGHGMGGVWLPATTNSNIAPILWRAPFPPCVLEDLVSTSNPHGSLTNSHLEAAGQLVHHDVLAQEVNLRGRTVAPLGDNIPTTVWHHKHSTTTTGPAAYLLRLNSIHQRHYRYNSYADYIPGKANGMADDPSRLWHLTDSQLLAYFNRVYPQQKPWQLRHPRPAMLSSVLSALRKQRPDLESLLNEPPTKTACGKGGLPSYPITKASTRTSTRSNPTSTYLFSKFSPRQPATSEPKPAVNLYDLNVYRTTYGPSPRRSVWGPTGAQTPVSVRI